MNVSLEDAEAFCDWARLELPDQRIWEHFARAGSNKKYWWGDDDTLLPEVAWIINNSEQRLHDVGEKRASTWCLYDIFGNVWEWTKKYKQLVAVPISDDEREVWRARVFGGAYDSPLLKVASAIEYPVTEKKLSIGFRCIKFT